MHLLIFRLQTLEFKLCGQGLGSGTLSIIDEKMEECPKIKCFWGFHCAFCCDDARHKFPMCERHIHKWETLNIETKIQIYSHVNLFNKGESDRRMLQIFIHRIEILDELNSFKRFYERRTTRSSSF
jgi:hypothetical protein